MPVNFQACGVISITTDFGHRGPFVGTMKGVMLSRFPAARLVDLTHEAHVHWPAEAGFWLERSFQYFPKGTVHLAVVDPGVGTERGVLLVLGQGHLFLAPDNGLLAGLVERTGGTAYLVDRERLGSLRLGTLSATFHGRDFFAPLAAALAAGTLDPLAIGVATDDYIPQLIERPVRRGRELAGCVITSDHFGNLITNIEAADLAGFTRPVVKAAGRVLPLHRTYGDVPPGTLLALVNSFEVLEIACAEQNAAALLGLGRGGPVVVTEGGGV
ncbi:MAG: SAM-dependent chlorinase/fluorinase [Gammaproteobacteria bacterium]|nr:SAM-dependent chlorinase/fluorinase [Gammaproteobacteria bacterium]